MANYYNNFKSNKMDSSRKITKNIDVYKSKNTPVQIPDINDLITIDNLGSHLVFLINFQKKRYEYVSKNIKQCLGISAEELITEGLIKCISLFEKDQGQIFISKISPMIHFTLEDWANQRKDFTKLKFTYNITMRHVNGSILNTLHIIVPISSDIYNKPLLGIKYLFDISGISTFEGATLKAEYLNESQETEHLYYKKFNSEYDDINKLSQRERDIAELVRKGYSSKEIADTLFISIHTVNNHRKNIMKKFNIQNYQQEYYRSKSPVIN